MYSNKGNQRKNSHHASLWEPVDVNVSNNNNWWAQTSNNDKKDSPPLASVFKTILMIHECGIKDVLTSGNKIMMHCHILLFKKSKYTPFNLYSHSWNDKLVIDFFHCKTQIFSFSMSWSSETFPHLDWNPPLVNWNDWTWFVKTHTCLYTKRYRYCNTLPV